MNVKNNSMPNYARPPVQEVGIVFSYNKKDSKDFYSSVIDFKERNKPDILTNRFKFEFIPVDQESNMNPQTNPNDIISVKVSPNLIEALFFDISKTKHIEITRDFFKLYSIRQNNIFPRFGQTANEIFRWYESFENNFAIVSGVELYYRDKIVIPTDNTSFVFSYYFNIQNRILPNVITEPGIINVDAELSEDNEPYSFGFNIKHSTNDTQHVYDINWHLKHDFSIENVDVAHVKERLDKMHAILYKYFDSVLTDNCKKLFE